VTVTPTPSVTKDITRFNFPGVANTETVIGAVPNADGSYPVSVWVPSGTDLGNLAPDITHNGTGISPGPGIPQDFNGPQRYTVTAEDGSTKTYMVTVSSHSGVTKLITSFIFDEVPLSVQAQPIRVVAAIDQAAHTITATVPAAADASGLRPTITYIGKSIAGPSGGDKTANPFTDNTPGDFSSPRTYTVKDQDGNGQAYTVSIQRQSSVSASFEGEADQTVFASNTFENGILTITVRTDDKGIEAPYEWYLDGVKQAVSTTETTFTLNVGSGNFIPGRHEITLSGKKNGLHYTGRLYFVVAGDTK
jgi:hypothetical protein